MMGYEKSKRWADKTGKQSVQMWLERETVAMLDELCEARMIVDPVSGKERPVGRAQVVSEMVQRWHGDYRRVKEREEKDAVRATVRKGKEKEAKEKERTRRKRAQDAYEKAGPKARVELIQAHVFAYETETAEGQYRATSPLHARVGDVTVTPSEGTCHPGFGFLLESRLIKRTPKQVRLAAKFRRDPTHHSGNESIVYKIETLYMEGEGIFSCDYGLYVEDSYLALSIRAALSSIESYKEAKARAKATFKAEANRSFNHYATLGLSPGASQEEIKKAYKAAAMKHHPDRGGSAAEFLEIKKAYESLKI